MISAIVPITERTDDVSAVYFAYREALDDIGTPYEFVYVVDGGFGQVLAELEKIHELGEPIKIVTFAQGFGEAAALSAGFRNSSGDLVLTLPAYLQIEPQEIVKLFDQIRGHDMVIARRCPRLDPFTNIIQARCFEYLTRLLLNSPFKDLGCGVRLLRREVADEIGIYGDQHRFLPLIAHSQGFSVVEADAQQMPTDATARVYRPGVYVRRILDIFSVYFLLKFTSKPLRFFGLVGGPILLVGVALLGLLIAQRLFFGVALADRPLLLAAALLTVLGIQVLAIGLVGELIIFVNRKALMSYRVAEVLDRNSLRIASSRDQVEPLARQASTTST